jgi:hypothetical protein
MGRPRIHSLDETYFERIDTKNKAYLVGFLYADGSVYNNALTIAISLKDIEIIEFIIDELKYGGEYNIYSINNNQYVKLVMRSKKMASDLSLIGVIPNKTYLSNKLPKVPNKFFSDMIRGFFDGDGSIYSNIYKERSIEFTLSFSSNKSILEEIKGKLLNYRITSSKIRFRNIESIYSGQLDIRGSLNIEKFFNLIYTPNSFFLKRKNDRFLEFFNSLLKIKKRKMNEGMVNSIKGLFLNGLSQKDIHIKLKIPYSSVRSVIQRLRKTKEIL